MCRIVCRSAILLLQVQTVFVEHIIFVTTVAAEWFVITFCGTESKFEQARIIIFVTIVTTQQFVNTSSEIELTSELLWY